MRITYPSKWGISYAEMPLNYFSTNIKLQMTLEQLKDLKARVEALGRYL